MLEIVVIISLISNALLLAYVFFLLRKMFFIAENTDDLLESVDQLSEHTEQVYNSDMFFGDETLMHLMSHTRQFQTELRSYKSIYSDSIVLEEDELEEEFEMEEE